MLAIFFEGGVSTTELCLNVTTLQLWKKLSKTGNLAAALTPHIYNWKTRAPTGMSPRQKK